MKKPLILSLLIAWMLPVSLAQAQQVREKIVYRPVNLWYGLRDHQPADELPRGRAPLQQGVRVPKVDRPAELRAAGAGQWVLSGGWEMASGEQVVLGGGSLFDPELDTRQWYNATVPGTVLTTLVRQGVYPDPYYGLNNLAIPDTLCRMDWWYRIRFALPEGTQGKRLSLLFEGINYRAEVYLNGRKLGNIDGAFRRGRFDITQAASGENILAVHILPPANPGTPHEQSIKAGQGLNGGQMCFDGPTFICSDGWDWMPGIRDRNIGIWQDVRLLATGAVEIGDPQIIADLPLPDTTRAAVNVAVELKNPTANPASGTLEFAVEGRSVRGEYTLAAGETRKVALPLLTLEKPRLWWPNGYGAQNLYTATLTARNGAGELSDERKVRFGVREMSYELMADLPDKPGARVEFNPIAASGYGKPMFDNERRREIEQGVFVAPLAEGADARLLTRLPDDDPAGPYLIIKVNGVRIFCRGGDWGMDDAMKDVRREKMEPYFRLHKEENLNIIRNWTGESTEEVFYDLCDEYGMLVWNDFWLTTENSNVDPNDFRLFMTNARDVVRRFRNHPSIALWCPRNEGFAPRGLEKQLYAMCVAEDPTRHYHGQSRHLNMRSSGPWKHFADLADYYRVNARGFNTELGCFSVPTANTIRKFIAPEDLWPMNDVWAYHDMHHTSQGFNEYMADVRRYGEPAGYEDFSLKAQFVNYEAWRAMLEAWNHRMWDDCTGLILWMSHPAWPSMIWQTYSWDYETHASFYGVKKACEPMHIQMNLHDDRVVIVNTTRQARSGLRASVAVYDLQGRKHYSKQMTYDSPANARVNGFVPQFPAGMPALGLVRLELRDAKGVLLSRNDYWKAADRSAYLQMNETGAQPLKASVRLPKSAGDPVAITLTNTGKSVATNVKLNLCDAKTGEVLLPAYFSDGYFYLLPGESCRVTLSLPQDMESRTWSIAAEGYNVPRMTLYTRP